MGLGFEELDRFAMAANHFIYEFAIKVRSGKRCQAIRNALMFGYESKRLSVLERLSGRFQVPLARSCVRLPGSI